MHDLFISNKVEVLSSKNLFSFDLNIPRGMSKDIIFRRRSSLAARGARTKKLSSVFNFLVFGMTNRPLVAERVGSELYKYRTVTQKHVKIGRSSRVFNDNHVV